MLKRGHNVRWVTAADQCDRLSREGFPVSNCPNVKLLDLNPLLTPSRIEDNIEAYQHRLAAYRRLHTSLSENRPDLILLDRVLAIGQLVAEQLDIPTAVVGTAGGHWVRNRAGVTISEGPVASYREVGDRIKHDLRWTKGVLTSVWARSNYVNISFLGKSYYGCHLDQCETAWHVHHFTPPKQKSVKHTHGVSFGNTGDAAKMSRVLGCLRTLVPSGSTLEIFSGKRQQLLAELSGAKRQNERIHDWVNFSDYFPYLNSLAFFGGISTIWYCMNHDVPMLVVPGGRGDQHFNAGRISELGLGECLLGDDVDCRDLKTTWNRLVDDDIYLRNIRQFRGIENYTDTLATAVDKLEGLH